MNSQSKNGLTLVKSNQNEVNKSPRVLPSWKIKVELSSSSSSSSSSEDEGEVVPGTRKRLSLKNMKTRNKIQRFNISRNGDLGVKIGLDLTQKGHDDSSNLMDQTPTAPKPSTSKPSLQAKAKTLKKMLLNGSSNTSGVLKVDKGTEVPEIFKLFDVGKKPDQANKFTMTEQVKVKRSDKGIGTERQTFTNMATNTTPVQKASRKHVGTMTDLVVKVANAEIQTYSTFGRMSFTRGDGGLSPELNDASEERRLDSSFGSMGNPVPTTRPSEQIVELLPNDGSCAFSQIDENLTEYRKLKNTELQEDTICFTAREASRHIFMLSPINADWEEIYPNVFSCSYATDIGSMVGYLSIEKQTIRPFEETNNEGPYVFIVLEGCVVFKTNQFTVDENGQTYLKPLVLTKGGIITIGRGTPCSIENRTLEPAKLFYFVFGNNST